MTWWGTQPANWRASNVHGASLISRAGVEVQVQLGVGGHLPGRRASAGT